MLNDESLSDFSKCINSWSMKISKNISLISVVIAVGFLSLLMSKLWPAFNTTTQREIDLIESLDTDLLENLVDSKKDIKKFTFQVAELDQKSIMVDIGLDSLLHIPESDIGPKGIFIRDHDWIILNLTSLKSSLLWNSKYQLSLSTANQWSIKGWFIICNNQIDCWWTNWFHHKECTYWIQFPSGTWVFHSICRIATKKC